MARYVMVLRSATSLRGGPWALEGVGPENRDFWAQKNRGPFKVHNMGLWYIICFNQAVSLLGWSRNVTQKILLRVS
jgi:hypothetical protein